MIILLLSRVQCANVSFSTIPKDPSFSSLANYRPISITTVMSKVFEYLVSVRLGRFSESSGVLPTTPLCADEYCCSIPRR